MTLSLTTVSSLESEAAALVLALRAGGVAAERVVLEDSAAGAATLDRLRDEGTHLLLTHGGELPDVLDGLTVAAVLPRDEPRDLLVPSRATPMTLASLPDGARVQVAGARRAAFLRAHNAAARVVPPGNGGGPLAALEEGAVDALILGAHEARRSGLSGRASEALDPTAWLPDPGQGTVVLLAREGDRHTVASVRSADDFRARISLHAERTVRSLLGAGPATPLGVLAQPYGRWIRMHGMLATPDGRRVVRGDLSAGDRRPEVAARALVDLLVDRGAAEILEGTR